MVSCCSPLARSSSSVSVSFGGRGHDVALTHMPYFRVQVHGTLLVEADSPAAAQVAAQFWTVAMKQATHGVEMQRTAQEKIKAVDLLREKQDPTDVTAPFRANIDEWRSRESQHPFFYEVVGEMCNCNYDVGAQMDWECFESKRRQDERARQTGE